jgi:uncharacterized RDD family membrane protein YckC
MRRWIASEIGTAASPGGGGAGTYPGQGLGLPPSGVGSAAGFGRRLAALSVDWLLAYPIAGLFAGPDPLAPRGSNLASIVLGVWFVMTVVAVAVFGITPGKALLGTRVASLDSTLVGVPRAVLRTLLLALVVPALTRDDDGRGWHDRATRTAVVRTRG